VMQWRFLEDIPLTEPHRLPLPASSEGGGFVLPYLISKLGDLELEITELEASAGTADDHLALRRLTAARNNLAGAADEAILRRRA